MGEFGHRSPFEQMPIRLEACHHTLMTPLRPTLCRRGSAISILSNPARDHLLMSAAPPVMGLLPTQLRMF